MLGTTHPDHTRAGPRQAQAGLRHHADAARELHARLVAQRCRTRRRIATCATPPAAGDERAAGAVNIDGRSLHARCRPTSRSPTTALEHFMHGLSRQEPHARRVRLGSGGQPVRLRPRPACARRRWRCRGAPPAAPARITDQERQRLEHAGAEGHLAAAAASTARTSSNSACSATPTSCDAWCSTRRRLERRRRRRRAVSAFNGDTGLASAVGAGRWCFAPTGRPCSACATSTGTPTTATLSNATQHGRASRRAASRTCRPRPRWPTRPATRGCSRPRSAARCASRPSRELFQGAIVGDRHRQQRPEPASPRNRGPAN